MNKLLIHTFSLNKFICLTFLFFLFSCSKSENENREINTVGDVAVRISVSGISENDNPLNGIAKSSSIVLQSEVNKPQEISAASGYTIELYAGEIPGSASEISSQSLNPNIRGNKLAAAMATGVKYRVLFYEVVNGNEVFFKTEEITTASAAFNTTIKATKNYKWYAYSYNDATMPAMVADVNNPVIPSKTNAPLLMASGNIAGGPYNGPAQHISIKFAHKVSKVELIIDAANAFATAITTLNANFQNFSLTTHNFNLKSGLPVGSAITTTAIPTSNLSFQNIGAVGYESSKQKSTNLYYTSTQLASIQFRISSMSILEYGLIPQIIINPSSPKSGTVNFSTPLPNTRLASVNVQAGAPINGVIWATGNLYYDALAPDPFKYKFEEPVSSGQIAPCNHYWQWNSKFPRSITGGSDYAYLNSAYVGDPCLEVYPKGTWKTPSTANLTSLETAIANSPTNGAVYFQASNGERVNFHEAGWLVTGSTACPAPANTNDGLYWSTSQSSTTNGTVLEIDERGGTGAGNEIANYNKRYGMSVRCIRNL